MRLTRPLSFLIALALAIAAWLPRARADGFAVVVTASGGNVVQVSVQGRPERLRFLSKEGDHTTAWAVSRYMVDERLAGKSLAAASDELETLLSEVEALPGATRFAAAETDLTKVAEFANKPRVSKKIGVWVEFSKARHADATRLVRAARRICNDGSKTDADKTDALQRGIAALLAYRNSIGLSVVYDGSGASGDGERMPLRILRYWEANWTNANAPDVTRLKEAIAALLTPKIRVRADGLQIPGRKPGADNVRAAILEQHRKSIAMAFPNVANRIGIASTASFSDADLTKTPRKQWAASNAEKTFARPAEYAVQLELAGGVISVVRAGERPLRAKLDGGTEGDHTTAWVVTRKTIEDNLKNKSLAQAKAYLDTLKLGFEALPGNADVRLRRLNPKFTTSYNDAKTELANAKTAADASTDLTTIQRYAGALMRFRNALPLSVVIHEGGGSRSHDEANLPTLEAKIMKTFDTEALQTALSYNTDDAANESQMDTDQSRVNFVPGYVRSEPDEDLIAEVEDQHLRSLRLWLGGELDNWVQEDGRLQGFVLRGLSDQQFDAQKVYDTIKTDLETLGLDIPDYDPNFEQDEPETKRQKGDEDYEEE
ncbi:MAG TPA: hypothetical protein VL463_01755 [Kofleriaceae bacterium]|jgi:hypothetical protein|nr:hypothetical protein [Kofleriaceae bacterium]